MNLAAADCVTCLRAALEEFYADKAAAHQAQVDDFELMKRTVKYLDDMHVKLEYTTKIGVTP